MSRPLEHVIAGQVAAPGLAHGVVQHLAARARPAETGATGNSEQERSALEAAVSAAMDGLNALAARSDAMAAEIVAFQVAMLSDPELTAPAFAEIAGGRAAVSAFRAALDEQIADYRSAEDAYFQARAADLADLRDRVLDHLAGGPAAGHDSVPDGAILVGEELSPSRFLETDWRRGRGIALTGGSATSHVAMLARARGVPFLIGLDSDVAGLRQGTQAILDAEQGRLVLHPSSTTKRDVKIRLAQSAEADAAAQAEVAEPAVTKDGTSIKVVVNVDDPEVLEGLDPAHCDGVGLTRSEFLFHGAGDLPDEERQYLVYREVLSWAGGLPVTIRTLDAGGDKPIPGLTPEGEANPFLGLRGLRLLLARPEVFRVQLRALARAACHGQLKVMVPMVTIPEELARARAMMAEAVAALEAEGIPAAMPAFGMMVETPAAALNVAGFEADFLSIGSNDLVQYVTAASRDVAGVAALQDPLNPAVMELIERVAAHGRNIGIEVSLCGEMASVPEYIPALLRAGLRVLSVPPAMLAKVKVAIAACEVGSHG